jgi:hypothetical protein
MKPLPLKGLLGLLVALCLLCGWQFYREFGLREWNENLADRTVRLQVEVQELNSRAKAADAEYLRLTGALNELKATSIDRATHDAMVEANKKMAEGVEKQNAYISEQTNALEKAVAAVKQAQEQVAGLLKERDAVVKRLNDTVASYNKLVGEKKAAPQP